MIIGKKEQLRAEFDLLLKQTELNAHLTFAFLAAGVLVLLSGTSLIQSESTSVMGYFVFLGGIVLFIQAMLTASTSKDFKSKAKDLIKKMK